MLALTSQDSGMYQCSSAGEHQMRGSDGQTNSTKMTEMIIPTDYSKYKRQKVWHNKNKLQKTKRKVKEQDSDTKTEDLERWIRVLKNNPGNLVLISDCVKEKRNAIIQLPVSKVTNDMYIRICGLDGTIYSREMYMLKSWEKLYLPKPTKMEVLGILESSKFMVPLPQWIVLVAEDGRVYGYEDKVLHLFATSLKEMIRDGIQDTGIFYDYPDDISVEVKKSFEKDEDVQRIREKTKKFKDQDADSFNKFYNLFQPRRIT